MGIDIPLKKYKSFLTARNSVYNEYRRNALRREIEWSLTYQEVNKLIAAPCHYCGIPTSLTFYTNEGNYDYNGIDRVDNTLGYIVTNVVPCCSFCNYAKGTKTIEEFRNWIIRVHSFYIEKDNYYDDPAALIVTEEQVPSTDRLLLYGG